MIELSFNEVELTVRKACCGLGWDYGIAEEFGRAASWAAECTDLGLGPLLELAWGDQGSPEFSVCGKSLQTQEATANSVISALDLLAADPDTRIFFARLSSQMPAAAALAGAASRSYGIGYQFRQGGMSFSVVPHGICGGIPPGQPDAGFTIICTRPGEGRQASVRRRARASVPQQTWRQICGLAARTLVPATEMSRRFGAGEQMP